MSTRKNLGQSLPAASTLTALYTAPAATSTVISSVVICNQGAGTAKFRVSHSIAGAADALAQYLYRDTELAPGKTYVATLGITMATTDILKVQSDTGQCSFNAYGQEN